MTPTLSFEADRRLGEVRLRRIRLRREQRLALQHPAYLLNHVQRMVDEKTGEVFQFDLLDPEAPWFWQRRLLDELIEEQKTIILKARQLGITWLCAGLQLAYALTRPGTLHLVYRQKEDDASEIIERIWQMFVSLPDHLKFGTRTLAPRVGHHPHLEISLEHVDGRVSRLLGMASTGVSGHGHTAASVLLDEAARIEKLREIWTAITPVVGMKGKIFVVSTANGISSPDGAGNFYHRLWVTAESRGLHKVFLGWDTHPERDQGWYETSPEILALDDRDRAEQYPGNANEAFAYTTDLFFDRDALDWYANEAIRQPLYRFRFVPYVTKTGETDLRRAVQDKSSRMAPVRLYEEPFEDHKYVIAADVATGRGADSSAAYVIDLEDMSLCAEVHAKIDPDKFAYQLYFLGKWFNKARIAVETASGFGEAVIIPLRDGKDGREPYPSVYRHTPHVNPDAHEAHKFGFQMNKNTRGTVLSMLGRALREKMLPWATEDLITQCGTFVYWETGTSPRAMQGCHDDCVMAAAIAIEMFRKYGHHPDMFKPKSRKKQKTLYPWMVD